MEFNENDIDVYSIGYLRSFHTMIMSIPDDALQLEAFRAVTNYMMTGIEPESMSWQVKIIMEGLKPIIDKSRERSKSGKKKTDEEQAEIKTKSKRNQNEIKTESNEEQIKNIDKDKDIDIDIIYPRPKARDDRFDTFWKSYPRKQKKKDAERAWKKINPDSDLSDRIIKAVDAWKRSEQWTKDGGRFIPYPSTWLNGCQWEDEVPKVRAPSNTFSNFPQRPRSQTEYEDIERALLGVRRHA